MSDITVDTSSASPIDTTVEPVASELPILIGEFEANSREMARVILENYRGHDLIYICKWYWDRHGKLLPGAKSFAVNVRHLPRLKELVDLALAKATEIGLLPNDDDGGA